MPNVTAGLKSPPEIRKKTQALTASEKPKQRAMYCSCCGFEPASATVRPPVDGMLLATWVPDRANQRKRTVPTNSPHMAMKWLRMLSGSFLRNGRRSSLSSNSAVGSAALVKGIAKALPCLGSCGGVSNYSTIRCYKKRDCGCSTQSISNGCSCLR